MLNITNVKANIMLNKPKTRSIKEQEGDMKKGLLLISLFIFLFTPAAYAEEIELPHITVFGTAVTKIVPDKMMWNIMVMNKDQLLENVTKKHMDIVNDVTKFLKEAGIGEDLQTSRMQFGENWEYRNNTRVKEGYYAQTYITFSMTDFNIYKELWLGLSRFDSVSVLNVDYDHTERIRYQNETRINALLAAKEKAGILAKSIGSDIAEPLLIEEEWAGDNVLQRANVAEARLDGADTSSVSPGLIPITMRIKAAFRLMTSE
jgi:uncharacterized protein YggE